MVAAARLQVDVDADTARAGQQLQGFMGNISRTGLAMAGLGAGIAAGAGVAAIAIGKIGISYDDALNTFRAVSGATQGQMDAVAATAKALGNDTDLVTASASDAAEAMSELAKGGLSVDESMKAAKGTLALAAAAGVSNSEAATIAANALNTFGLKGAQAGKVADILAAGANSSSAELTQMAQAIAQAGASAGMAGLSLQDTTAIIGQLANKGLKGSDAGTSLKTMLQSLMAPTDEAKAALKGLGVSVYDAQGNMRPFRDILGGMEGGLKKMTEAQRNQALQTIFGSDAIRAASILTKDGVAGFDAMRTAVDKNGAALEVAGAKSQGFGGQVRMLKSTLETLAITIYDSVKGPLASFTGGLISGLNASVSAITTFGGQVASVLGQLRDAFAWLGGDDGPQGFGEIMDNLLGNSGAYVGLFRSIGEALLVIRDAFTTAFAVVREQVIPAIDSLLGPIGGLDGVVKVLAAGLGGGLMVALGSVAAFLAGAVVTAIVAAVTALVGFLSPVAMVVAGLVLLYKNSETFRDIVTAAFGVVKNVVEAVFAWFTGTGIPAAQGAFAAITETVRQFVGYWQAVWPAIKETVRIAWDIIKPLITAAIEVIKNVIQVGMAAIKAIWDVAWTLIKGTLETVWGVIKGVVDGALNIIRGVIKTVLGVITGDWRLAWDGIKAILEGVWTLIKTVISGALGVIKTILATGLAVIKGVFSVGWTAIKAVLDSAWEAIKGVVEAAWVAIKESVKSGIAGLLSMFGAAPGQIKAKLGQLDDLLRSAGKDLIMGLVNGIGDMAGAAAGKAAEVAKGVLNSVKGALGLGSPSRIFRQYGKWSGEGLIQGLDAMAGDVARAGLAMASGAIPDSLPSANLGLTASGARGSAVPGGTVLNVSSGAIVIDARGATPEAIPMLQQAGDDMVARLIRELQSGRVA